MTKLKKEKTIISIAILLVISLFLSRNNFRGLSSNGNNIIPTDNTCINFTKSIIKYSYAYKNLLQHLKLKAESANSATNLTDMIDWAFNKGLDVPEIREAVLGSPYFKELKVSQVAITRTLIEIKESQTSGFISAIDSFNKYIPSFKKGLKAIDKARYYDFTIEALAVKDQCRIGGCWAYAGTSFLEQVLFKKLGKKVELSTKHYYGQFIANEVKKNLFYNSLDTKDELFEEGAMFVDYMAYIKSFGIMPKSAYKLPIAYDKEPHKTQLYNSLREILNKFYREKKKILKKDIEPHLKEQEIQRYREKYAREIDDEVQKYSGDFKQEFTFNNKIYTPLRFYKEYIADLIPNLKINYLTRKSSDYYMFYDDGFSKLDTDGYPIVNFETEVIIYDKNVKPKKNKFAYFEKNIPLKPEELKNHPRANMFSEIIKTYNKDTGKILKIIKNEIDNKNPVYISFEVTDNIYVDPVTKKEYNLINNETGKVTSHGVNKQLKTEGGHAVLIVGYEVNHKGELKTLKIQNSWGTRHGDDGFLHMDVSYLNKYGIDLITLP